MLTNIFALYILMTKDSLMKKLKKKIRLETHMQNHISLTERQKYCSLLAQNLSTLRVKANLTQGEMADKLGYTRVVISDYENEKRPMNWKHFATFVLFFSNNTDLREIMIALGILDEDVARVLDVNLRLT